MPHTLYGTSTAMRHTFAMKTQSVSTQVFSGVTQNNKVVNQTILTIDLQSSVYNLRNDRLYIDSNHLTD